MLGEASRRIHTDNCSVFPPPQLDFRDISHNIEQKRDNAVVRKAPIDPAAVPEIARLYEEQKDVSSSLNVTRHSQNIAGDRVKELAANKKKDPHAFQAALEEAKELKAKAAELESQLADVESKMHELALSLPNDTHPDVPRGPEDCKKVLSEHGPPPLPASPQRDHLAIGRKLGLLDMESASTVTGSSWYYLTNEGALLEMALISYALSIATRRGFKPVTAPDVVRSDIAYRCGFQPRDPTDQASLSMYHVTHDLTPGHRPDLVLTGTAEIPLAGMFANKVFYPQELPAKLVGLGRAFRPEAGASGVDTRGLFRVHQFTKLELFAVTQQGESEAMMEELRSLQTEIFEGLGLTFQ